VDKKTSKNRSTPLFSSVIPRAKSLPTGRQAKDPSAFSNNQQPLLCMGFLPSAGRAWRSE